MSLNYMILNVVHKDCKLQLRRRHILVLKGTNPHVCVGIFDLRFWFSLGWRVLRARL